MKKRIIIELKDNAWKEMCDTVQHELGEPLGDDEIENIVKKGVAKFIHETYIRGLGA